MSHAHAETPGIVIHGSRAYDIVFGPLIRTTDAAILARAGIVPGDRVLDVGTGPGYLALAAAKLVAPGGAAVGIDASPEMIARARARAAQRGSQAEYTVATAESLPFESASFDVVVSRLVFHHLPGDAKVAALREMARVLRPHGRLLIVDFAAGAARGAHRILAHVMGNRPDAGADLKALIHSAGFTKLTSGTFVHGMLAGVAARNPERGALG